MEGGGGKGMKGESSGSERGRYETRRNENEKKRNGMKRGRASKRRRWKADTRRGEE